VHKAYGHVYFLANNPAIAPLGEARPNTQIFRELAARMGFDDECFKEGDEQLAAGAIDSAHPRAQGITWDALKDKGWMRCHVPDAPFARGGYPTPSGRCEFYSDSLAAQGISPVPTYVPPYESVASNPQLAQHFPLAMISPPARNFLNSSFVNVKSLRDMEGEPLVQLHPQDAAARSIHDGRMVRVFNDRGSYVCKAHVTDRAKQGVVVGLGIWWRKLGVAGTNVNEITHQQLTDIGRAACFYDCLVEVVAIPAT
jgi:anaerobic selenocysteine-containing dehydrogenase